MIYHRYVDIAILQSTTKPEELIRNQCLHKVINWNKVLVKLFLQRYLKKTRWMGYGVWQVDTQYHPFIVYYTTMISQIHQNDVAKVFGILLNCSIDLDIWARDLQRIAMLDTKCREREFIFPIPHRYQMLVFPQSTKIDKHKKSDPRTDTTPPTLYECMNELKRLLDDVNDYDDDKIKIIAHLEETGDGKHMIFKPIKTDYVIEAIKEYNDMIIQRFEDDDVGPKMLVDCFSQYSENKYHPLYQHGSIMSSIYAKLEIIKGDLRKQINNNIPLDTICKYIINTTTPSLKSIAMEIRSNIVILKGGYFSKLHAVKVATQYEKHSKERGDAIRHMVDNKYVPSRSALDRLLKAKENGQFIVDDEWNTRKGGQARPSILLENERFHAMVMYREPELKSIAKQPSMSATKQKGEWRDTKLKQLKSQLKDEIPELKVHPVEVPSYVNEMLSELFDESYARSIEHILTSELKTNDDSVFLNMKNIKSLRERDIEDRVEYERKKKLYKGIRGSIALWPPPRFNPVKYVRKLVNEANNREWREAKSIQQHNKEIQAKIDKLLKEEQEERRMEQELQKSICKNKEQYKQIGSLLLALHSVEIKKPEHFVHSELEPILTTSLYAPPKLIDVCNEIGLSGNRLYFSPKQFPVTNLKDAGDNETFKQLKQYIVKQSSANGNSPVVLHGTDSNGHNPSTRFICKYAIPRNWKNKFGKDTPFRRCKFTFLVKWDEYGYYIHTSKPNPSCGKQVGCVMYDKDNNIFRQHVVGCEFHNH